MALNPFPGTLTLSISPVLLQLVQPPVPLTISSTEDPTLCGGHSFYACRQKSLTIVGFIVTATLGGQEGVIREPTLPAAAVGPPAVSTPLVGAQT